MDADASRAVPSPRGGVRWGIVRDTAWYGAAGTVAKLLALLSVPVLTRTLSPAGYGLVDLAIATAALLTLVALLSADIPAARISAISDDDARRRALVSYVWVVGLAGILLAVLLLPLASVVAEIAWGEPVASGLAVLAIVLVPISAVQAALAQTQRIQSRARTFAVLEFIDIVAQLGLAVLLVVLGLGPEGVLIGFIIGSAIGLAAAAAASRNILFVRPLAGLSLRIARDGVTLLPYTTAFVVADWAMRAVVANVEGLPAVADMGVALRLASALTLIGGAFALAWGPVGLARSRGPATAALFRRGLVTFGATSTAAAIALGLVGTEVVRVIAGDEYLGAAIVLPALALAAAVAGTEYVLVIAATVAERHRAVAIASSLGAAAQVMIAAILVGPYGLAAVGPAVLFGRVASFAILLAATRHDVASRAASTLAALTGAAALAIGIQAALASGDPPLWTRWALAVVVGGAGAAFAAHQLGLLPRSAWRQPPCAS